MTRVTHDPDAKIQLHLCSRIFLDTYTFPGSPGEISLCGSRGFPARFHAVEKRSKGI